jgi:hypothetical protein
MALVGPSAIFNPHNNVAKPVTARLTGGARVTAGGPARPVNGFRPAGKVGTVASPVGTPSRSFAGALFGTKPSPVAPVNAPVAHPVFGGTRTLVPNHSGTESGTTFGANPPRNIAAGLQAPHPNSPVLNTVPGGGGLGVRVGGSSKIVRLF